MTIQDSPILFQASVEITIASGEPLPKKRRAGDTIALIARFRDFLGEPTSDTGPVTISTTKGVLSFANGGMSGTEIVLAPGEVPIDGDGELAIAYKPGGEFGNVEISIACKLGEANLEIMVPAPSGFALAEILESVIYAFMVAMIIRLFFFQTFWIPSGSMEPTLYEGDRIITNKLIYRLREPRRSEVIIFRVFETSLKGVSGRLTLEEAYAAVEGRQAFDLNRFEESDESLEERIKIQDYIKRVIGLPGDVIEVDEGIIYVNGEVLIEDFETKPLNYNHYGPETIPPGEVFVLGDNRSNSQDSHVIGPVPIHNIEGRAEMVFWPPSRICLIPH